MHVRSSHSDLSNRTSPPRPFRSLLRREVGADILTRLKPDTYQGFLHPASQVFMRTISRWIGAPLILLSVLLWPAPAVAQIEEVTIGVDGMT